MSCKFRPVGIPAEVTLPHFPEFLKGAQVPSNDGDCQLPCRVDAATSIVTPTNRYNAPLVRQPQNVLTQSGSTAKATGFAVASKKCNRDFHQLFRSVPEDDCLIDDYSCALQRDIKINQPSLKNSLNGVRPEGGTAEKTEKVDPSPFEHSSASNASRIEKSEISDTPRRSSCQWQGRSNFLVSFEDQAVHEALHHKDRSLSVSALLASENNKRPRRMEAPEDTFPIEKKRQRVFRCDSPSTMGSSFTKTGSSASSKTIRAKPTLETDNSDMDQVVQHKVEEGKVAHKRAEQIRRNELSSLITELEHCIPSEFLNGCQRRNQKPGYTKNGTLKATLTYHKHQAAVIEEQDKIIKAQAAANAALKERNAALMQQGQQCGTWNEPSG